MEKEKKISALLTVAAIVLILLIGGVYMIQNDAPAEKEQQVSEQAGTDNTEKADENGQEDLSAESAIKEEVQADAYFIYTGELPDIIGKTAEELYAEAFSCTEDGMDGGILDNAIYVDYNNYHGNSLAIYITEDHVLHGNYGFGYCEEIYLENIKFARAYAEQVIALGTDGSLWCLGKSYSISDGRKLVYNNWQKVLEDVVYASLGHYNYMAITSDGSLYMWGDNTYGQFGDGSLLKEDTGFKPDCYFYPEPVKVADNIKMIWQGKPGLQYDSGYEGTLCLRSYILTSEDELYVCGEAVDDEIRRFSWFGELGDVKEFYAAGGEDKEYIEVNCTSKLYPVK